VTFPPYPAPRKLNIRIQAKRYGLNDQRNKAKHNVSSKKGRILPSGAWDKTNNSKARMTTPLRPGRNTRTF
jgi:hypothetical protein